MSTMTPGVEQETPVRAAFERVLPEVLALPEDKLVRASPPLRWCSLPLTSTLILGGAISSISANTAAYRSAAFRAELSINPERVPGARSSHPSPACQLETIRVK
jgi:hypothetical protein